MIARHARVAKYCRERAVGMGLKLFPRPGAMLSPTVTALYVPAKRSWKKLDESLRERGVVVGGNYGCLAGKVFRIGHMGSQADMELVKQAMDVLESVVCG